MSVLKRAWLDFLKDESGMGVVEIILIIVVLIAMVLIFKEQIKALVENIWESINQNAKKIY
ncbi:MAG: Flp1 family type IVb pilin [Lachnospiraceae bacterium]